MLISFVTAERRCGEVPKKHERGIAGFAHWRYGGTACGAFRGNCGNCGNGPVDSFGGDGRSTPGIGGSRFAVRWERVGDWCVPVERFESVFFGRIGTKRLLRLSGTARCRGRVGSLQEDEAEGGRDRIDGTGRCSFVVVWFGRGRQGGMRSIQAVTKTGFCADAGVDGAIKAVTQVEWAAPCVPELRSAWRPTCVR